MPSAGELKADLTQLQEDTEKERDNFGRYGETAQEQQERLSGQDENVKTMLGHIAAATEVAEQVLGTAKKVADTDDTLSGKILESSREVDEIHGRAHSVIGGDTQNDNARSALENLAAAGSKSEDAAKDYATAKDKTSDTVALATAVLKGLQELADPSSKLGELAGEANAAIDSSKDTIDEVVGHTNQAASDLGEYNAVV